MNEEPLIHPLQWVLIIVLAYGTLFACCSGCRPPNYAPLPSDHQATVNAARAGWGAAGLPAPGDCLNGAVVQWAADATEFRMRCRIDPSMAAACTTQTNVQRGLVVYARPVALLRPGQALFDSTGSVAVHEWMHVLSSCLLGSADPLHRDPRVWTAAGGPTSAQGRARDLLLAR